LNNFKFLSFQSNYDGDMVDKITTVSKFRDYDKVLKIKKIPDDSGESQEILK